MTLTLFEVGARQVQAGAFEAAGGTLRAAYAALGTPDRAACAALLPLLDDLTLVGQVDAALLPGTVTLLRAVRTHVQGQRAC
ncbi:hypothetical protein GCM10008959_23200 [Deinococcus seoulensis]|uniref:Uncharacterized protein n=1 Tax=Deinococcus seoulensis TaxID=1837379 RepID=A0ABQ2RTI9_9DEIO|nr:hypothetical protein [Deinococcus seoulensis]GGR60773.1 hypothetical protein GCM10008959_23200 [Deinococcus seoulensis]